MADAPMTMMCGHLPPAMELLGSQHLTAGLSYSQSQSDCQSHSPSLYDWYAGLLVSLLMSLMFCVLAVTGHADVPAAR